MRGKIIIIEGTDGSGKKTQSEKLFEFLLKKGKDIIKHSFPSYESPSSGPVKMYLGGDLSNVAEEINAYQASTLFAVDRFCTMKNLIKHYDNGGVIIFDRYVQSNMLHQAGKIKNIEERDAFLQWLDNFEFEIMKLPRPDKIIFLDMPVSMSKQLANSRTDLKAGTKKDIHEQNENHLMDAYDSGIYVSKKFQWTVINCINEKNELKTIKEVHEEICEHIKEI